MIRNFFLVAIRQITNNKTYSIINIGGLGIGLACCIAIGLYIFDELSYDRFHPNKNVYRVTEVQQQVGELYPVAVTPGVLAKELKNDFQQIEYTCRIGRFWRAPVFQTNAISIEPGEVLITDNSLFTIFHFPLLYGDAQKALAAPGDVVLTERVAIALFGDDWQHKGIIGKEISLNSERPLTIAGVAQNPPLNSHIQFDALLSMVHEEASSDNFGWNSNNYHTYISVRPNTDLALLEAALLRYLDKHDKERTTTLHLQHLHDIYLHSDFAFQTDWSKHSSFLYIKIFVAVGTIVMLIAVFNFINLCTARAMNRAKEVGVRKVVGAAQKQLVVQFLLETFIMIVLAVVFALFILQVFLSVLNEVSGKSLVLELTNTRFIGVMMFATVLLTFLSGLYPAFYLSVFKPAKVLKGYFTVRSGNIFRKTLVIAQFTFSVILIIGTIVIYHQLEFLQNKNLGFERDNLIAVYLKNDLRKQATLMKRELIEQSSIAAASITTSDLVENTNSTGSTTWEGMNADDKILLTHMNVDHDFLSTTGMTLLRGRNFDVNITSDTISAYILNETAARRMGYTSQSAIGKKIKFWDVDGYVIGVVKDFHFRAMTAPIEPMLLRNWPSAWATTVLIKARGTNIRQAINAIEKIYRRYESQTAPSYTFIDQALQNLYRLEQNTGKIVLGFAALAIIVSCLGLFGLATHTAEQRTKEIGVRKVLGASISSIVRLLSLDFVKLVAISIGLAIPLGWWSMNEWLRPFAYKIDIEWWFFASAAAVALVIAFVTVSFKSISAATMNPVKSLRSE
jgi:ABC-type antimicrobial peptide transport system permease subunit